MLGIYIHVPFCAKRCTYCDFYTTTLGDAARHAYTRALLEELRRRAVATPVETLYFGGGTPSQLADADLRTIFAALRQHYNMEGVKELTFEANPDDITAAKVELLSELGVNRISLGVQSFDDELLRSVNRRHTAQQARDAIDTIHRAGIHNISIDLIFGLPSQDFTRWENDLRTALSLDVQHLSAYALSYEPGTPLYRQRERGQVVEADEELSLRMFQHLIAQTAATGFEQYEISNFARTGKRALHNAHYWQGIPYLGFGPGAHSFDGRRTRTYNLPDLKAYQQAAVQQLPFPIETEQLTDDEHYNEVMMTRLRTREGIDLTALAANCGSDFGDHLLKKAQPYLTSGHLLLAPASASSSSRLHLSREGIFISDHIMADLIA